MLEYLLPIILDTSYNLRIELVDKDGFALNFADGDPNKTSASSNVVFTEHDTGEYTFWTDQYPDNLPLTVRVFDDDTDDYLAMAPLNVADLMTDAITELLAGISRLLPKPVTPGIEYMTLVRGDDYNADNASAWNWTSEEWADLTGATVVWTATNKLNSSDTRTVAMSVIKTGLDCPQTVRLELDSATTSGMLAGTKLYYFDVQATLTDGSIRTIISPKSLVTVLEERTPTP